MSSLLQKVKKGVSKTIRNKNTRRPSKRNPSESDQSKQQAPKGTSSRPTTNNAKTSTSSTSTSSTAPAKRSQRNATTTGGSMMQEPKSKISRTRSIDMEETPNQPDEESEKKEPPSTKEMKKSDKNKNKEETTTTKKEEKSEKKRREEAKSEKKKAKKVWSGVDAAEKFVAKWLGEIDKIRAEFNFLDSLTFNKTTEAFDANTERNRPGAPKMYDENRVILDRPGQEAVNYINASEMTVKDFGHKVIICQMPRMENESFVEDFWLMMYQKEMVLLYLLLPDDVLHPGAAQPTRLFKTELGEYQYVGKMFINNRRSEPAQEPKEYSIEVLPEGNSNSVLCQVHHLATWHHRQQAPKTRPLIKMIHHFLSEKQIQSANVCVMSEFGCGRACSFLASLIAVDQLNKGIEPNICEIMTDIKKQRPGAVESFSQYCGIYAVVLDYISRKRGNKKDEANKNLNRFIDELAEVSPPTSPDNKRK